jgi:DNA-binding NarL/FixJ family response regulator
MEQVKVILADPLPVVISGFRNFIEKHPRLQVIAEATTLTAFEEALAGNEGCVAIVDWQMTSLESALRIAGKSRLILYAMPDGIEVRRHALRIGVRGFIGKNQSAADIRRAVYTVASGQIWIGKTTAEEMLDHQLSGARARSAPADRVNKLTNRERQVIQMACQGLKSRAIALALRISEPTVAHHLTSIYSKLEVKDRIGLIIYAYRHCLQLPDVLPFSNDRFDGFPTQSAR